VYYLRIVKKTVVYFGDQAGESVCVSRGQWCTDDRVCCFL